MMTSLQRLNSTFQEGLMIGCVEAQRSFILSVLGLTPDQKRGRPEGRPKSREETPKEGTYLDISRPIWPP